MQSKPLAQGFLRYACWCAIGVVVLCSCDNANVQSTSDGGAEGITTSAPLSSPDSKANEVAQLETVSCDEWDQRLAAHEGKIIVVDTWATWCVPCLEEFPQLVALHQKYAKHGVECMSVSVDEPEQKSSVLDFLTRNQANFANYLIDDNSDAWWDKWNIKGIPIVLVFDVDGKLARKFDRDDPDNQFTYEDVEKLVVELLNRNQPDRL